MMSSGQYLLKSEKEGKAVGPFAQSAYLNEFNSVCVLHLSSGPGGTLHLSLPPRDKVCMVWVEGLRVKIQSA